MPTRDMSVMTLAIRAESLNEETRSVEAVVTTDRPVRVFDMQRFREIDEVLVADGGSFPEQTPLLDSHNRKSMDDQIGSARGFRQDGNGEWVARVSYADDGDKAERTYRKVQQGHAKDISLGYRVSKSVDIQPGQTRKVADRDWTAGDVPLRISQKWSGREVSQTPIGADEAAKIRAEAASPQPLRKGKMMNKRLLAFLRKVGLAHDANDEQARSYLGDLTGSNRVVANTLDYDESDESARTACDQMLRASGWDPEDPTKVLTRNEPVQPVRWEVDTREVREAVVGEIHHAEPSRVEEIRSIAADVPNLPEDMLTEALVDTECTTETFRTLCLEYIRERRSREVGTTVPSGPAIHSRSREQDVNNDTLTALLMRRAELNPVEDICRNVHGVLRDRLSSSQDALEQAAERSERYEYLRPWEIVREAAILGGTDVGHSPEALFHALSTRATQMSTANIANIFTTTFSASLLSSYNEYPDSTQAWTMSNQNLPDFNLHEHPRMTMGENMSLHARGGSAEHTTYADKMEEYKAYRYSKQFAVDEMDIMDDHRFNVLMTNTPRDFGQMSARVRPDLVYAILLANAALADTGALFNATAVTTAGGHANLTTSAGLTSPTLKAGLAKLNTMTENSKILASCTQPFLLTGEATHFAAAVLNESASVFATDHAASASTVGGDKNVLQGLVRPIKDARIDLGTDDPSTDYKTNRTSTATDWYLIANSRDRHTVEVGYVQGTNGRPTIRSFVLDKGQWGVGWDIKLDIGAKALDYLGMQKFTA